MIKTKIKRKWQDPENPIIFEKTITKPLENTEKADINELNKTITKALTKTTNELCPKREKENKIRPHTKASILLIIIALSPFEGWQSNWQ